MSGSEIVCENVSKLFDANSGIKNINLRFSPGMIYGIIGYNGAGKTTLLRCIEGLYYPDTGTVSHNAIKTTNEKEFMPYRKKIAFLPSDDFLYPKLTCLENIELVTVLRTGKSKLSKETEELIRYFEAGSFLHKRFRDCSTGMKKKVQIIASLVGDIDVCIWDEPNDGLDIVSNIKIKTLLNYYKSRNVTILLSCHVLEFLEDFIDYCVLIKEGTIVEETLVKAIPSLRELYQKHTSANVLLPPSFFSNPDGAAAGDPPAPERP